MGNKIFVSYKYSDPSVLPIKDNYQTTPRHYVDELTNLLEKEDHIYKGEDDGEDLESLADSTIGSKLGDKIFDSTITIVLISKGMKNYNIPEKDQWIPWEISYSLKEQSRAGGRSKTNAVLAVVIPDEQGKYDYFITHDLECNTRTLHVNVLFQILKDNMFNLIDKESNIKYCKGTKAYVGHASYIHSVKWDDFTRDIKKHIEIAQEIRRNIDKYELVKGVKDI